jgi:hypothetical protein
MLIVYGRRLSGKIDACGSTWIETMFAHLWYLPLIPMGSHLMLGGGRSIAIGLSGRSVLAAYLRSWGVIGAIGCIAAAASSDDFSEAIPQVIIAVTAAAVAAWAWIKLGRLSRDEVGQREAYVAYAGHPVDVALLAAKAPELTRKLHETVASQARGLMGGSYRSALDPETQWHTIALDPTVIDRSFLEACLTLARLEGALAQGPERGKLEKAHHDIWKRLRSLRPSQPALAT